jgi:hypothetical protein
MKNECDEDAQESNESSDASTGYVTPLIQFNMTENYPFEAQWMAGQLVSPSSLNCDDANILPMQMMHLFSFYCGRALIRRCSVLSLIITESNIAATSSPTRSRAYEQELGTSRKPTPEMMWP